MRTRWYKSISGSTMKDKYIKPASLPTQSFVFLRGLGIMAFRSSQFPYASFFFFLALFVLLGRQLFHLLCCSSDVGLEGIRKISCTIAELVHRAKANWRCVLSLVVAEVEFHRIQRYSWEGLGMMVFLRGAVDSSVRDKTGRSSIARFLSMNNGY